MRGGHKIIATVKEKVTFYFQRCTSAHQRQFLNEIKTTKNLQVRNNQCFPKRAWKGLLFSKNKNYFVANRIFSKFLICKPNKY